MMSVDAKTETAEEHAKQDRDLLTSGQEFLALLWVFIKRNWKLLAVLLSLLVFFITLNWTGFQTLMTKWDNDANYGHGYLIPFISLYFVWAKKDDLQKMTPRASMFGLPILIVGILMSYFAMPLASSVASGLAIVVILNGLLLYLGGWSIYKLLWLPALYLFFMVPLPQEVHTWFANPLQEFASFVSAEILGGIFNVFVARSGNVIRLAGHQLQVAEACSGMRSIMGLLALGIAFAYFWERALWERLFLVVSTVPIAILANICRVTGTGLMYHWGYERFAQGFYHEFTGWFVFIFAMALFLLEAWVMTHLFVYEHPSDDAGKPAPGTEAGEVSA